MAKATRVEERRGEREEKFVRFLPVKWWSVFGRQKWGTWAQLLGRAAGGQVVGGGCSLAWLPGLSQVGWSPEWVL